MLISLNPPRDLLALILTAALVLSSATLTAQERPDPSLPQTAISGLVIDAATGVPLAGARVALELEDSGTLPRDGSAGSLFLPMALSTVTNNAGSYRFGDLPHGRYRIHAERVGYRTVSVVVDFRGAANPRLSLGLTVQPIPLQPVEINAPSPQPFGDSGAPPGQRDDGRLAALRQRQQISLASDSREITHADVVEAVTLGETDLFRAMQRLPGVTTRDDYSAEFWLRGASWDQTRVYFDGLPLFNPMHGVGAFSGVNTAAVGAAWLHPGGRSAALAEGVAGVLDLRSRRGTGDGELNGQAELSMISSSVALDQRVLNGRGAWMLAARRSYLDLVTRAIGRMQRDPEIHLPYAFSDVAGRFDYQVDAERALEVSGLWERDSFHGDLPDILHGNAAHWGNAAARATWQAPLRGLRARHTVGVSRYGGRVREVPSNPDLPYQAGTEPPSHSSLLYASIGGRLEPRQTDQRRSWAAGYEVIVQDGRYYGSPPTRLREQPDPGLISEDGTLGVLALWGKHTWRPDDRMMVDAGLRLELGPAVRGGGVARPSPRISARYQLSSALSVSAAAARVYQYSQSAGETGAHLYFPTDRIWLVAGGDKPVLRGDVVSVGAEVWLGKGWMSAANAYLRESRGVAIPDPVPGRLDELRPYVFGDNRARGVELSLRRLTGQWTASAGYTLASSEMRSEGMSFPAGEDRRHKLNAAAMLRAGKSLRIGAAYTGMSGAPITRDWRRGGCDESGCDYYMETDTPNAARAPGYASMDLLLDWTWELRRWDLAAYVQVRNVLRHDNSILYNRSEMACPEGWSPEGCSTALVVVDTFDGGLPMIPLVGLRLRF